MRRGAAGAVSIREAVPEDRPAMLDLWVEAWTVVRPEIDFAARRAWLDGHLDALRRRGARCLVAVRGDGGIAGFATLDPGSGEMDQVVTSVRAQRQGIGRALVREAKRLSSGALALSVNQFNTAALTLYHGEGFSVVGEGVSAASGLPVWHMRWTGPMTP